MGRLRCGKGNKNCQDSKKTTILSKKTWLPWAKFHLEPSPLHREGE